MVSCATYADSEPQLLDIESLFSNEQQEVPVHETVKTSNEVDKSLLLENSDSDLELIDEDSMFSNEKKEVPINEQVKMSKEVDKSLFLKDSENNPALTIPTVPNDKTITISKDVEKPFLEDTENLEYLYEDEDLVTNNYVRESAKDFHETSYGNSKYPHLKLPIRMPFKSSANKYTKDNSNFTGIRIRNEKLNLVKKNNLIEDVVDILFRAVMERTDAPSHNYHLNLILSCVNQFKLNAGIVPK